MKSYVSLFRTRLASIFQYRAAALASLYTQIFFGFIRVMIFTTFYQSATGPMPMALQETITYIWLAQILMRLIPWNVDTDLEDILVKGNVAYELVRPINLFMAWFSRILALRLAPVVLTGSILFPIALLFLGLDLPKSLFEASTFCVSALGSLLVSASYTALLTVLCFWSISTAGLTRFMAFFVHFFSGLVIPLPLFPDFMQGFLKYQPFAGLFDTPLRLYMGHIPSGESFQAIGLQFAWTALFLITGHLLMKHIEKKVVIQGG